MTILNQNSQLQLNFDTTFSIAVIVCSYDLQRYPQLKEAVESLLNQSHRVDEIIVVISGNSSLREKFNEDFSNYKSVQSVFSEKSLSASGARNKGIRSAKSEILAFTDDDAIADSNWVACLIDTYQKTDAFAVGGKILPIWLTAEPDHLPEEMYWLVGLTHESIFAEEIHELRNTYGPNMSFRRIVFETVGLFNENLSFADKGTTYIQGEEPEFGLKMINTFGKGIVYNPQAIIYHKVPGYKLGYGALFRRSFYQGYTKAIIQKIAKSSNKLGPEKSYLKVILGKYLTARIKSLFTETGRISQIKKIFVLLTSVACVGAGYIFGQLRHPLK